ncbi:MAG: hypothetical protein ACLQBQ_06670, partial [Smithella sp.]
MKRYSIENKEAINKVKSNYGKYEHNNALMSKKEKDGNKNTVTPNDTINTAINRTSKISSFFTFSEKLASSGYLRWLM